MFVSVIINIPWLEARWEMGTTDKDKEYEADS
jgi:hypothetical protein